MRLVVNGGFDPLHSGHIEFIELLKALGSVTIILNDDETLVRKKGYVFLPLKERLSVIQHISGVEQVIVVDSKGDNQVAVLEILESLRPCALVVDDGSNSAAKELTAGCRELGIAVIRVEHDNRVSSSQMVAKGYENFKNATKN